MDSHGDLFLISPDPFYIFIVLNEDSEVGRRFQFGREYKIIIYIKKALNRKFRTKTAVNKREAGTAEGGGSAKREKPTNSYISI